jgi:hypothetical protein
MGMYAVLSFQTIPPLWLHYVCSRLEAQNFKGDIAPLIIRRNAPGCHGILSILQTFHTS